MSEHVWLVIIPETYDGLTLASSAHSYILTEEPDSDVLFQITESGGNVYVIPRPDGDFNDIAITVNGDETPNSDDGFDLSYEDESNIEIELESDEAILTFNHEYQNQLIVFGYAEGGEPFYAADYSAGTIYRIDSGTGETLWSLNNSDFQDMNMTPKNLFSSNDGSYVFVMKAGLGLVSPPGEEIKIYLINSDGSPILVDSVDIYNPASYISIASAGFDPVQEKLYVHYAIECYNPEEVEDHSYLKIYNKSGSLISTTDTGLETVYIFIGAYNGNILLVDWEYVVTWNGNAVGLSVYGEVLDYGFDQNGNLYIYYEGVENNATLSKINNGGIVWTRSFDSSSGAPRGLSVNKYGDCTCVYIVGGGTYTSKITANNSLVWTRETSVVSIDNNGNLYV